MKRIFKAYILMSAIITVCGYIFGLSLEQSLKIGFFAGLYMFIEKLLTKAE